MSTPLPLRRRVALALTALGFLLSALFAATTIAVTEDYEHVLASEILRGQAEDYGLRLSNGLPAQLPKTHRLSGYARADVPPHYARLAPGVHEDATADGMHIGVFDTSAGRLYFTIDLSDIEALEFDQQLVEGVNEGWITDEEAAQPEYQHDTARTIVREGIKVGRNDACPCGSGKKFKHCHGQLS